MRVLIIGGTGFVSSVVVSRMAAAGHDITVFHREAKAPLPSGVSEIIGDRMQLVDFAGQFRAARPDIIVDMIPYTQRDARNLVAVSTGLVDRLVVISSVDVYRARDRFCRADPGPPDATPLTEDSPLRDRLFPYSDTRPVPDTEQFDTEYDKVLVERVVMAQAEPAATIIRLPMVYGPGDTQHRTYDRIRRMDDSRPFILMPDDIAAWRAPRGYVEDVAEAISLCAVSEAAAHRVYHVGDSNSITEEEWVERIGRSAGWNGKIVLAPNELLPLSLQHQLDAAQDWSLDTSRIRRELGYSEPTSAEAAIQRTVEWERLNPDPNKASKPIDYAAEDAALDAITARSRA